MKCRDDVLPVGAIIGTSYSAIACLQYGQIGIFLAAVFSLLISAIQNSRSATAGFLLVMLSTKHVLFYPLAAYLGIWILFRRRWRLLVSFLITLTVVLIVLQSLPIHLFRDWMSVLPIASRIAFVSENSTLADLTQGIILRASGVLVSWPMFAFPALGILLALAFGARKVANFGIDWPLVLCLSLACAPYGWVFDQTLLILVELELYRRTKDRAYRKRLLILLLLVNLFIVASSQIWFHSLGDFTWLPLLLGFLCILIPPKTAQAVAD